MTHSVEIILDAHEIRALFDYLWDEGIRSLPFIKPDPPRHDWEHFAFCWIVHEPATRVMEDLAIDEASDTGDVTLWRLPNDALEAPVDEVVTRVVTGKTSFVAKCPLKFVKGPRGLTFELDSDITIEIPTRKEIAKYSSRHHKGTVWRCTMDELVREDIAILEVKGKVNNAQLLQWNPPKTGIEALEEEITDTIAIVKWALSATNNHATPLIETTITYEDIIGGKLALIGTGEIQRGQRNVGTNYDLTSMDMDKASCLIKKARKLVAKHSELSKDLKDSFWYWNRASLAALQRDALVEAVIGLENLVVGNTHELRYRFSLHGAALVSKPDDDVQAVFKDLRKIYDLRSSAVHGSTEEKDREARKAIKYLSKALLAVIELCDIKIFESNRKISDQIEERILKNSPYTKLKR